MRLDLRNASNSLQIEGKGGCYLETHPIRGGIWRAEDRIIYTLKVQGWCLPTHFTNVEVYLRICVMSMFTHQCRRLPLRHEVQQIYQPFVLLPDLYLGHASLVKLMRYHLEPHLTWHRFSQTILFCFHSTIHICLHESGRFALDPPKLNLVNKRHHGRGVSTKASQGISVRWSSGWPDWLNKQENTTKAHYILGVAWGCSFPRVNISFHG